MISRDVIWDLVYSLIEEDYQEQVCQFEGVKKYEDEVEDIVGRVEDLASMIEKKIEEDERYLMSGDAAADAADEKLHQNREEGVS